MILAALDIGNATTELVLARVTGHDVEALTATRRPTVGVKGSPSSLRAAVELLIDTEGRAGVRAETIVIADIVPSLQRTTSWPQSRPDEGTPVTLVDTTVVATRTGSGTAVGRVVDVEALDDQRGELIVVAGADSAFPEVVERLNAALDAGLRVVGVLLHRDEAVLVGNRLRSHRIVVIDEVDTARIPRGATAVLETGADGAPLGHLTDPVWLASTLGLPAESASSLVRVCASLRERSCGVVVRGSPGSSTQVQGYLERGDGDRLPLALGPEELADRLEPGTLRTIVATPGSDLSRVVETYGPTFRDLFAVRVRDARRVPFALLSDSPRSDVAAALSALTQRRVLVGGDEATAAYHGALSTPGAPPDCAVIDIGGGTIDVATTHASLTVAGAGDLVTAAIAELLNVPTSMAELVKLHPSLRVESPHIATTEDGDRIFLDDPAPGRVVGWLCVQPSNRDFVPFSGHLAAGQWRDQRFALKRAVLGASVRRALRHIELTQANLLLTGGGACDDESVSVLGAELGTCVIGRADIAGRFGPRWAVAWGLATQYVVGERPEE